MKIMEEEKGHQFLIGFDDDKYTTIYSQILTLDTVPSVDKMFNMVK